MKRQMALWGIVGVAISAAIFGVASVGATSFPALIQHGIIVAVVFVFLLGLSIIEIPMMLYGLRLMVRNQTQPMILVSTFIIFVTFAAVYASIFVALTANVMLGSVMACLSLVRYVGGLWIK